jgi:uncharacterized glyoxalase superfamily protein PhnB
MATSPTFVTLVPIRNMSRAVRFYSKQLGGKVVMRGTGEMKNSWAAMRLAGHDIWLISPDKREKRSLAYMTLLVKNAKQYTQKLKRLGVKFERATRMGPDSEVDGSVTVTPYGSTAFFKDPEGNLWMVFQAPVGM